MAKFFGTSSEEKELHWLFEVGVIVKGVDGFLELVAGMVLFLITPSMISTITHYLIQFELSEDPNDVLANYILNAVQGFSHHAQLFYAFILTGHGAIKLFLVAGLLKNKLWAYPAAIAVFILFILYQSYQLVLGYSVLLAVITIVDVAVVFLISHEYWRIKRGIKL